MVTMNPKTALVLVFASLGPLACGDDGGASSSSTGSGGGTTASSGATTGATAATSGTSVSSASAQGGGGDGGDGTTGTGGAGGASTGTGGEGGSSAPLTPLFFSDWRTMNLGTSNDDVQDGGKWDVILGDEWGEIIAAPEGFPTDRALLVEVKTVEGGLINIRHTGMPIPPVDTTRNYRWYYRHDQPDWPEDNSQHPIQDGNAGSQTSWVFGTTAVSDVAWRARYYVQVNSGENPYEISSFYPPELQTGTVYRFELQIHRTGEDTFEMHGRVHGADDTLLHDDDDFTNVDAGGDVSLADAPTFHFNAVYGPQSMDGMNAGCNGITGQSTVGFPYAVQAGFAIVDGLAPGEFIGAYGSVEGEVPPR
jgi:hypothetical protein